jgi:NAD(P)H-dependent FMN reductase
MERIQVITGTTRPDRFGDKPARWVTEQLAAWGDLDVELIDLRDYPDEATVRLGTKVDEADGFVFVTAEYNHGYPAILKNALDHLFPEWHRKPVAFVGYGDVGGAGRSSSCARSSSRWPRSATPSTSFRT